MSHEGDLLKLRTSVKRWEREFEARNERKPTNSDARADKSAWALYQQYRSAKKRSTHTENKHQQIQQNSENHQGSENPSTPRKKAAAQPRMSVTDTEEDEEATPLIQKVTEVFPTPQIRGKVLGLFDVQLDLLQTPQKSKQIPHTASPSSSSPCPHTPGTSDVVETPQSKRTPEYFQHRVNLFPALSNQVSNQPDEPSAESPLITRKASRTKPVREIIREASEIAASKSKSSSILEEQNDDFSDDESRDSGPPILHISSEPDIRDTAPITSMDSTNRRFNPKRQTKRIIMRPVYQESELSSAKATDNFVRLKINNKNRNFKRRR